VPPRVFCWLRDVSGSMTVGEFVGNEADSGET
jgi:hypothetical protein